MWGKLEGMSEVGLLAQDELNNVIELKPKKVFTYAQINELLPIVVRITRQYSERVNALISKLDLIKRSEVSTQEIEAEINSLVQEWQIKLEKLGAVTKGLWIADFDSSDGYYCWKYPEEKILHWHGYKDGFSGRRPIQEYLKKYIAQKVQIDIELK